MEIPMKMYWMGEDIETLPRERLIEIISHMGRELDASRDRTMKVLEMSRAFAAARARF